MKHPRRVWLAFAICLAIVLAAMGWISLSALRLGQAEAEARRQAALEGNVQPALWRIDTTLAPLIAQESARPYFAYRSFLTIDRSFSRMFNDRNGGETLIPSPLLAEAAPNVLVHFQFEPDGRLTSPEVPLGANSTLAVPRHVSQDKVTKAESLLDRVAKLVTREKLLARLPEHAPAPVQVVLSPLAQNFDQRQAQRLERQSNLEQYGRGTVEYQQRSQVVKNTAANAVAQQGEFNNFGLNSLNNGAMLPSTDLSGVLMTPLWIDGQLLLARRVTASGQQYVQGCLLDWAAIRTSLLETIEDLLPGADLEPVTAPADQNGPRMLAALPVRLVPGAASLNGNGSLSPIVLSLAAAWACVLLAGAAVALLLAGVMRLSERRASFVTAVTHELRTPLTTFQMYAEMLAEGMVPDPEQQRSYLNTLRAESLRLTHLVENVLAYARLERGRANGRKECLSIERLVAPLRERLAARAEQAGMELVVEIPDGVGDRAVWANASAVEQVLFNLVDNACKYAAAATDKRIHLGVACNGAGVELSLRDHGPGVSPTARRRLFRSFSKSAHEAAQTAPGVGLGLALSRRLARDMGGRLRLDRDVADGARFVLTLPAAEA